MTLRRLLVLLMVLPYAVLGMADVIAGKPRTGVSAALLSIVNLLIYWR